MRVLVSAAFIFAVLACASAPKPSPAPERGVCSLRSWICEKITGGPRRRFDSSAYERARKRLQQNGGSLPGDLDLSDEAVLAFIDLKIDGTGVNFRDRIGTGDSRLAQDILQTVADLPKYETASEVRLKEQAGKLFRALREQTLKQRLQQLPKQILERWQQMPDAELTDLYLEVAVSRGLTEAYARAGLLTGAGRGSAKLDPALRGNLLQTAIAVAWAVPAVAAHAAPPLIPSFDLIRQTLERQHDLIDKTLATGLLPNIAELRARLGWRDPWSVRWNFAARAYTTAALIAATAMIPSQIHNMQEAMAREQQQRVFQTVDDLAQPQTPEELGRQLFAEYVKSLRDGGIDVDESSPEMQTQLQIFIEAAKSAS